MRSATISLLGKEAEQLVTSVVWLVVFSLVTVWISSAFLNMAGSLLSYLSLASFYASSFLVIAALAIAQRLIVNERYGRTRRFVEALPIRRHHESAVKFLTGLGILLALAFGVWTFAVSQALQHEPVGPRFMLIMSLRLSFFVLTLWSLIYTFSHLGRLRIPLAAAFLVLVLMLDSRTEFELSRFGPMALVDDELFSSERSTIPLQALVESTLVAVASLALCHLLLIARNGSVVERLSTALTAGERSFAAVMGLVALILLGSLERDTATAPPIPARYSVADGRLSVEFWEPAQQQDAEALAGHLGERLRDLEDIVTFPPSFTVRVALETDARGYEYSTRFSDAVDGVLVGANFAADSGWSDERFAAYVVHQMLYAKSNGRYVVEPHHAMLDGFSLWISSRTRASSPVDRHLLQALYADERSRMTPETVRHWERTSEVLGDSLELALAYSGWWALARERGVGAARALARVEYNRPVYGDVRDWWADRARGDRFGRATGSSWRAFLSAWRAELDRLRGVPAYAAALAEIPRGEVTIASGRSDAKGPFVGFELVLDRPLHAVSRCYAVHGAMPGYDAPSSAIQLKREHFDPGPTATVDYRVEGAYAGGSRVFAALECTLPQFAAPLRLGSSRIVVR